VFLSEGLARISGQRNFGWLILLFQWSKISLQFLGAYVFRMFFPPRKFGLYICLPDPENSNAQRDLSNFTYLILKIN